MIGLNLYSVDDSATHIDLSTITSAVLQKATSRLTLFQTIKGRPVVTFYNGAEACDLFNALTKIKAGLYYTV
jgi:hypothetical protein